MSPHRIRLALFVLVAVLSSLVWGCEDRSTSLSPPGCDLTVESQPVLIEFYGPHCPDCVTTEEVLTRLAEEYDGRVRVEKINVHEQPDCANAHDVRRLPTVVLYHNGEQQARWAGPHPAGRYRRAIDKALAGDSDAAVSSGELAETFDLPSGCEDGACEVTPN
jgi:thiol-disulfide isomerase/thioredoxin